MAYIEIVAVGDVERHLLDGIAVEVAKAYDMPVNVNDWSLPLPESAYHALRRQYSSSALLALLRTDRDVGAVRTLGVTDVDLYVPRLNFVFGEAALGGAVGVISLTRLRPEFYGREPDSEVFRRRIAIEAIHELGHTFGLSHCRNESCVMRFSNRIEDSDRKGVSFCDDCAMVVHGWLRAA